MLSGHMVCATLLLLIMSLAPAQRKLENKENEQPQPAPPKTNKVLPHCWFPLYFPLFVPLYVLVIPPAGAMPASQSLLAFKFLKTSRCPSPCSQAGRAPLKLELTVNGLPLENLTRSLEQRGLPAKDRSRLEREIAAMSRKANEWLRTLGTM